MDEKKTTDAQQLQDEKLAAASGGAQTLKTRDLREGADGDGGDDQFMFIWCPRCGRTLARCTCGE